MSEKKTRLLLWKATETQKHDIIPKLLAKGISVDEPLTDGGMTGLHLAWAQGDLKGAQVFLENGADVEAKDNVERTPLHFAAANGRNIDLIVELISKGATVDAQSLGGDTPLMKAIMFDNVDAVVALLEKGASKTLMNAHERNAENFAKSSRNEEIISALDSA